MGVARINLIEAKNSSNHIKIKFKNGKIDTLWLHCTVFPLFCKNCQQSQTGLFLHSGSRYGQVGSLPCEFCGASIAIVDHDNIVESIKVNDEPCSFEKLYLLSADSIEWFEEWYGITLAPENLFEGWTDWVSVDQLREQIETLTGIETDDGVRYQTDERFNPLPPDINRWINLLDKSTVPLPDYVSKIGEEDAKTLWLG